MTDPGAQALLSVQRGGIIDVVYEQPACDTRHAWARVPVEPTQQQRAALKDRARHLLKLRNAVMVSHYYVHPDLQDLAEETGGIVADSLEMARFGRDHAAQTLVVSGVRFMGETAKILSPDKCVLMPDPDATCSLDLGCPIDAFSAFCDAHPDRTVVVYSNTSAAVKARADWVVTSGCAVDIVRMLADQGQKVLWAPDKHLSAYVQAQTGADMVSWEGSCIVHDEFKAFELQALMQEHPEARVLVHPESPPDVVALAHTVGSTAAILKAARTMDASSFIVATDAGMLYKLRTQNPGKTFIEAPTAGNSATCKSCAQCPWMAMNGLAGLVQALETGANDRPELLRLRQAPRQGPGQPGGGPAFSHEHPQEMTSSFPPPGDKQSGEATFACEVLVDPALGQRAKRPIDRMLAFTAAAANRSYPPGALVPGIGAG